MKKYNVVIVGGGSHRNPDLMAMLADNKDRFPIRRICLYDTESERQEIMGKYGEILMREYYPELEEFAYTTDPDVAFKDVDFALMQIRAGRLPMREKDEKISLSHGCVGQETCGAGGFAYGLRSVPDIIELVKMIRKHSPEAWILNYSNPAAIVAEATKRVFPDDHRILNICDMPIAIMDQYANILKCSRKDFEPRYFGLNHFGWFTHIYDKKTGEDLEPKIKELILSGEDLFKLSGVDEHTMEPSWIETYKFMANILRDYPEYLPNTYLKYYLYPKHVVETSNPNYTRANEVMDGKEKRCYEMMEEVIKLGKLKGTEYEIKPGRGVHASYIVDLACAIINNTNEIFLIITKNKGVIPNVDENMMVEVACRVGANGVEPLALDPIPTFYKGMMENQYAYEKLTVDGLFERDKTKLLQALALNRTVTDTDTAKAILDDLIEANKDYWGKYFK
ncbi:6-phospho-alpha-glucosidase [Holdemanella porci]|jgi:alpha-galactosidase/6-phospho-beta-glucosidase family protein|uniref:6-phospho-alpha-glucosidase n=1 Tax=Holdemanella porci TaxID=2652276 RepID=A0A6N7VJP4_9FIRM|nr:6-phospho-alpha-glucosidase [Holdemanella porci]MSS57198.1 6-phospho-alpha-glucosidase [Holdemanella porci]